MELLIFGDYLLYRDTYLFHSLCDKNPHFGQNSCEWVWAVQLYGTGSLQDNGRRNVEICSSLVRWMFVLILCMLGYICVCVCVCFIVQSLVVSLSSYMYIHIQTLATTICSQQFKHIENKQKLNDWNSPNIHPFTNEL